MLYQESVLDFGRAAAGISVSLGLRFVPEAAACDCRGGGLTGDFEEAGEVGSAAFGLGAAWQTFAGGFVADCFGVGEAGAGVVWVDFEV